MRAGFLYNFFRAISKPENPKKRELEAWLNAYLCCLRLSCLLNAFPQTSQVHVTSSLCDRSWIMRLYGFVNRRWQNLQTNSHLGLCIFRRNSRRSSVSTCIIANMIDLFDETNQANSQRPANTDDNLCKCSDHPLVRATRELTGYRCSPKVGLRRPLGYLGSR